MNWNQLKLKIIYKLYFQLLFCYDVLVDDNWFTSLRINFFLFFFAKGRTLENITCNTVNCSSLVKQNDGTCVCFVYCITHLPLLNGRVCKTIREICLKSCLNFATPVGENVWYIQKSNDKLFFHIDEIKIHAFDW